MTQPSPESIKLTPQQFANLTAKYAELLETDVDVRQKYIWVCGSLERAKLFAQRKGVSISEFANLMDVPVTTVRHYLRMGVVTPFIINGKFRFEPGNVVQFESVRQWQELGMILEEILELRERSETAMSLVRPELEGKKVVTTQQISDEEYAKLEAMYGPAVTLRPLTPEQLRQAGVKTVAVPNQRILEEYKVLREKLEARKTKIEAQLARVAQLEAALAEPKG